MITRNTKSTARRLIARVGRAFTLVETLVAIAAVSVITVAIAGVFAAVGDTVTQGRSVSRFTTYASRLERQLRDDISNMTRDGFFVIRHELVGDNDFEFTSGDRRNAQKGVALSAEDRRPRPRRSDEMVFFRKGTFTSQRQPPVPGLTATADAARIYYGHGIRFPRNMIDNGGRPNSAFAEPQLGSRGYAYDDVGGVISELRLGGDTAFAPTEREGPNAMAGDWTLLRHVTGLAQPSSINSNQINTAERMRSVKNFFPTGQLDPTDPVDFALRDREFQLNAVPAAVDVFGSLTQLDGRLPPGLTAQEESDFEVRDHFRKYFVNRVNQDRPQGGDQYGGNPKPHFASGIIDLATTDLEQIRSVVLRANQNPILISQALDSFNPLSAYERASSGGLLLEDLTSELSSPGRRRDTAYRMQFWMRDAFPVNNHYAMLSGSPILNSIRENMEFRRTRMRYEDDAPGFFNVLNDGLGTNPIALDGRYRQAERNWLLSDRQMLSAAIFAPGVSEFIVEWSFGQVEPTDSNDANAGEMIWHGLAREGDTDFDGAPNEWLVREYPRNRLGDPAPLYYPFADRSGSASGHVPTDTTIHGLDGSGSGNKNNPRYSFSYEESVVLYSHFGYIDPEYFSSSNTPPTVPWPWPKLVRVTMTLSDPSDPQVQETFQFVFRVPEQ